MRFIELGQSKLRVGRLIYGTEPFNFKKGPDGDKTQGDKTPEQAAEILKQALAQGVNVWDTSDDYGTHLHVKEALTQVKRGDVIIADKSNALSEEDGWKALDYSHESLGISKENGQTPYFHPYSTEEIDITLRKGSRPNRNLYISILPM